MPDAEVVSGRAISERDVVEERGKGGVLVKVAVFEDETAINYNEPVRQWLCCYFFHRREQHSHRNALETIVRQEAIAADPAMQAKAHKFAQLLYFQDDMAAERRKLEADRKALELERQTIPLKFRMYNWGKPAPPAFTERVLRQESRIGLCTTFEKCMNRDNATHMK
ncbi:unnamed protein product [Taenia asiatica]|uniref:Uncharacterized protein n=1 Tax=Taenia asiatica TaxID=60517 RepID=A0A0R3W5A6_TAEAS|nr:unnamed protein product [Taenia asiatica]